LFDPGFGKIFYNYGTNMRLLYKLWILTIFILMGFHCGKGTETPTKNPPKIAPKAARETAGTKTPPTGRSECRANPPKDMLFVPGGRFTMGLDDKGDPDERPAHEVTVKDFFLDTTEVTNAAYDVCVRAEACKKPLHLNTVTGGFKPLEAFRTPDRPVNGVSHDDADTFCRFVGKRLPTEAEWERAARGDDNRLFPWGNELPTPEVAVYQTDVTAPVGSKSEGKGPFGHLDLGGNLWEWVSDRYDPFAYIRSTRDRGVPAACPEILEAQDELRRTFKQGFTGTNPIPVECEYVLRGGAFNYSAFGLRSSNRVHHAGRFRIAMAGFRCAKDLI
jgi:formylglycine-generating enzyme required for sulfatase activity